MKKISLILALIMCALVLFSCGEPKPRDIKDDDGKAIATGYYDGDKLVYEEKVDSNGDVSKRTTYDDKERVEKIEEYSLKKLQLESVYTYTDTEGKYTVKTTKFNNKGVVVLVSETKYEDSRPVSETRTVSSSSESDPAAEKSTYKYEKDGSVIETITSGDTKVREVMTDKDGKLVYDREYSNTGTSVKTFYDDKKQISKIENYNAEGNLIVTVTNIRDENGVLTKTESYAGNGQLKDYSNYVYKDGSLVAIYKYYADGTIQSTILYDSEGKATVHSGVYMPID